MSPQMNGEPRDLRDASRDASTAAQPETSANGRPAPIEGDRPLLEAVNTEGVTQTSVTKEDSKLAPLFTQAAATDFRARWDRVQKSFVDDPGDAVHAADELVAQVVKSLAESFSAQCSELEKGLNGAEAPSTENLRIALRKYRSFFERLLSI